VNARILDVKHSPPDNPGTPAEREARAAAVVAYAKALGKKIPRGLKLIGFRQPTAAERDFAKTLLPRARKRSTRSKAVA
jgi:hypothetical protein